MGVIGILFLLALFTGIGFVIHRWGCERRKDNDAAQQHHQPASTTCSAHTTQPTKASRQQESSQPQADVSDIPEATVIWVSAYAPPLPDNYYDKSNA
jgi:hypothetical protein